MPLPAIVLPAAQAAGGVLGSLLGKRSRSSCRTVSPGDMDGFLAGRVVPHVLWERFDDIEMATGRNAWAFLGYGGPNDKPASWEAAQGSAPVRRLAELHLKVFVPICEGMEGGKYTTDPNSGEGLALYNSARAQFREQIRSGQLRFESAGNSSHASPYGETGPGGNASGGSAQAPAPVNMAGGLALGVGALVLLLFAAKGN